MSRSFKSHRLHASRIPAAAEHSLPEMKQADMQPAIGIRMKLGRHAFVVDQLILDERQGGKHLFKFLSRKGAMSIERNVGSTDGRGHIKVTSWSEHPCQFPGRFLGALRIDRVTVSAQPDVFDDAERAQ
jgi:hypothetical protein